LQLKELLHRIAEMLGH